MIPGKNGGILMPWQPGQSGNPKGLPKGYKTLRKAIREVSVKKVAYRDMSNNTKEMRLSEAIAIMLFARALYKHDMVAVSYINAHLCEDEDSALMIQQNNFTQNNLNSNPLGLTDDQVLRMVAILDEPKT